MLTRVGWALREARVGILIIGAIYAVSLTVGIFMTHTGNRFALNYRDSLVARAHQRDPAALANDAGSHTAAAAIDFSRNLGLIAIPETIGGLTLVLPVGLASYRGWVGGIVSVDRAHQSRLRRTRTAASYLVTLLLQLTAFTLAGGGGLHLGLAFLRKQGPFVGPTWFRLPKPALVDVAWLYVLIVPLFALGSFCEFFWPAA
jgi:uncharacterized membrane protein SpoIIM required for sporulation